MHSPPLPSSALLEGIFVLDGVSVHARALEQATTVMRNREVQLVTHKKIGITAIASAIASAVEEQGAA